MQESTLFRTLVLCWLAIAPVVFVLLLFVTAPYGRHTRGGWGPMVGRTFGWVLMESPAVYVFGSCLLVLGSQPLAPVTLALCALWLTHYVHRAFIFPFRLRGGTARMPLSVAGMALLFNLVNGYLQGRQVALGGYTEGWLVDPRFVGGALLFFIGMAINVHSDTLLLRLRRAAPAEGGDYRIPRGGLHRWVSCPNYLGELIEWTGWAVATWSMAGLAFAAWTAANLVPRARSNHRWYRERFSDYPPDRRAIIPLVF